MTTQDQWKKWTGVYAIEYCIDLVGPIRRRRDRKRRDKLEARRRKREDYARWAKYQNAIAEKEEKS